jgi:hypothetical protein
MLTISLIVFLVGVQEVLFLFDLVRDHLGDLFLLEGAMEDYQGLNHQREAAEIVEEAIKQLRESLLRSDQLQVLPLHAL